MSVGKTCNLVRSGEDSGRTGFPTRDTLWENVESSSSLPISISDALFNLYICSANAMNADGRVVSYQSKSVSARKALDRPSSNIPRLL
jgi:hypothetical protein